MSAFERVMDALRDRGERVIHRGGTARTRGLCHDGDAPDTVAISIGKDKQVLIYCHKGCPTEDFIAPLGLTMGDLFDEPKSAGPSIGALVTSYPYEDANGVLRYYVDRYVPKTFRPRMVDGSKGFPKQARVLYRLPAVLTEARAGGTVFLCEGEKDADNLTKAGACATTMPGGTGMGWLDSYTASLRGANMVVILADRDEPGVKHAHKVAALLTAARIPNRIMQAAVGKDVTDHLAAGLGFDELQPLDDTEAGDEPSPDSEEAQPEEALEEPQDRFPSINWAEAFATDFSRIDWLPGKFMERGQQVALVGPGKAGKSIFVQYWIYCAITGRSFLGDEPRDPLDVLYFDRENNLRDIVTRMIAFGATPEDLQRLDYRLFPRFSGSLDQSAIAAAELIAIVDERPRDLVIFDTVSRFITGKENDADTWLQFYGRVHAPLKARAISGVRLDHMGKDEERGARGNSAKSQDVDHVWELTRLTENKTFDPRTGIETITTGLKLNRTHTRSGLGEDLFLITRHGQRRKGGLWVPGGTRHELTDVGAGGPEPGSVEWIIQALDRAGVPANYGRDRLRTECTRLGIEAGTTKLEEVARSRKSGAKHLPSNLPPSSFNNFSEPAPTARAETHETPGQTCPADQRAGRGQPHQNLPAPALPLGRGQGGGPGQTKPTCTVCHTPLDPAWHARGYDTHVGCDPMTGSHPPAA